MKKLILIIIVIFFTICSKSWAGELDGKGLECNCYGNTILTIDRKKNKLLPKFLFPPEKKYEYCSEYNGYEYYDGVSRPIIDYIYKPLEKNTHLYSKLFFIFKDGNVELLRFKSGLDNKGLETHNKYIKIIRESSMMTDQKVREDNMKDKENFDYNFISLPAILSYPLGSYSTREFSVTILPQVLKKDVRPIISYFDKNKPSFPSDPDVALFIIKNSPTIPSDPSENLFSISASFAHFAKRIRINRENLNLRIYLDDTEDKYYRYTSRSLRYQCSSYKSSEIIQMHQDHYNLFLGQYEAHIIKFKEKILRKQKEEENQKIRKKDRKQEKLDKRKI